MSSPSKGSGSPPGLLAQFEAAFQRRPDSAGILQGKRKIRKGRAHARTVLFPSPKNGGFFIACEGRLEGDLALDLELHPRVGGFRGQAIETPGPYNRAICLDFGVLIDGRYAGIDVKPAGRLASPSVTERMCHMRLVLAEAGIPHYIFTEVDLQREPHRQIRRQLRKGLYLPLLEYQRDALLAEVRKGPITVAGLRRHAVGLAYSPFIVEKLAAHGYLSFPITAPWRETTSLGEHHGSAHSPAAGWGSVHDICCTL